MEAVLTLTVNPTIDKSCTIGNVVPERKLRCSPPRHEPGGGGLNVTRAIRKLGGESQALYLCGGPTGIMLRELLDQEEIVHRPVFSQGWTRENLIVYESSSGQQFRFGMPGPRIAAEEWNHLLEAIHKEGPKPSLIVASGSLAPGIPTDFYARVARIAGDLGARLILDTSGEALQKALDEGGIYLIKPNIGELREIAGAELVSEADHAEFAGRLIRAGKVEAVVISLGAAGGMLVTADGCERLRAPAVAIKSKVGAGDSMVAGITLRLAQGWALPDAVRYGVAAGGAAVMTEGTGLCRREDTERLYQEMRIAAA